MNNTFIIKSKKWLQTLLPSASRPREALCWKKNKMWTNTHSKNNLSQIENGMKFCDWLEYMYKTHLTISLLPRFVYPNPIFKLELSKKTSLPYRQHPLLYIWGEKSYLRRLSQPKKNLKTITSNNLSISISSCKNKSVIKRNVLGKKWKK
jgi:hypothetical protein